MGWTKKKKSHSLMMHGLVLRLMGAVFMEIGDRPRLMNVCRGCSAVAECVRWCLAALPDGPICVPRVRVCVFAEATACLTASRY